MPFLGFEDKMPEMLRSCFSGLASRFKESASRFEDLDALTTITLAMAKKRDLPTLTPEVRA